MITAPAPDIIYRGTAYRLSEPGREQGASVRFPDQTAMWCAECSKGLPVAGKAVRMADRLRWLHLACAVKRGVLSPADQATQARRASVGRAE